MQSVVLIFAVAAVTAGTAHAQEGRSLLQRHDCYICHADAETRTGPAYVEIAGKYHGDPTAMATLTTLVKKGAHGSGPWRMPPMPQVPDAEARKMVEYILSLKP